jgi:hypothetical protein
MQHILTHSDTLGLLYCILHVKTLLLGGISREGGELFELDTVLEGHPCMRAKALVRLFVDGYPGVLAGHFLDDLVPFVGVQPQKLVKLPLFHF